MTFKKMKQSSARQEKIHVSMTILKNTITAEV